MTSQHYNFTVTLATLLPNLQVGRKVLALVGYVFSEFHLCHTTYFWLRDKVTDAIRVYVPWAAVFTLLGRT